MSRLQTQDIILRWLIPEFNQSIPSSRGKFGSFVRMPQDRTADSLMSFPPSQHPSSFPIPDKYFAISIT